MAIDITIIGSIAVALVLATIIVLWIFQDRFGFNKGIRLGPYEFILDDSPYYHRKRRSVNDVTSIVFKDKERTIEMLTEEVSGPFWEGEQNRKELLLFLRKVDPNSLTHSGEYDIGAFVLSSLMGPKMLTFVIYRAVGPDGAPKPFPSSHSLASPRAVFTTAGLLTRRLVLAFYFRFPKTTTMNFEGLGKRMNVSFLLPYDDAQIESLRPSLMKILEVSTSLYAAIPSVERFSALLKSTKEDLKRQTRIANEYLAEINKLGGRINAQQEVVDFMTKKAKGTKRYARPMVPIMLYLSPIMGAIIFQYGFDSNPIFGVILGTTIAVMTTLAGK